MKFLLLSLLAFSLPAAQTLKSQAPSYANFSIMLVSPASPNGSVVLMHNPKNEIEFVDVNNTKDAFAKGYVPVRAAELGELITALQEENENLKAQNAKLQTAQPSQGLNEANCHNWDWLRAASDAQRQTCATVFYSPSTAQQAADAEKRAQRQQIIQDWILLQSLNRGQNLNVTVTNCAKFPALCAGR